MKPIKVFYLITGLHVGGAEQLLLQLVRCLDRSRYEPVVAALVGGELIPEFEKAGVRVYNLRMRHKLDLRAAFSLRRLLLQEQPEILHTHLVHADLLGRVVGRWCGVPVIVTTLHMLEDIRCRWFFKTLDRWASRLNNALIAVSEEVKRSCVRVERLDSSRIHVIPNAIEKMGPFDSTERQSRRQRLHLPKEAWLVGVVSRLEEPRKGHRVLLEAMSRLVPRWPHLHCVLIGDGLGRQSLEAYTQALGLQRNVTFLGTQHDIGAWLSALDLFVLPSLHEGSPIALLEAMAAGCPIIATRVGGVPEMLPDQEAGLLVSAGDANALAPAMERLLTNRNLAAQLGSAAQRRFDQKFEMRQVVRQTEVLYDLLLNRRHPKQVKVLEVATTLDAGGVTTYLVNLVRLLPRRNFEIHLASGMEQFQAKLIRSLEVPHHPVALTKSTHPFKDLKALWQLVRLIRRQRFDLVHTNMSKSDLVAGLAARLSGVPCVSTAHGPLKVSQGPSLRQVFFDQMERLIYRTLQRGVISVSQATTQRLLTKKKVRPEQVVTIPNGIDPEPFNRNSGRDEVRRKLSLRPEQPVIGMVGRLKAPKTPEVLIQSVRRLAGTHPDLVCLLIGDGPQARHLLKLIHAHRLEGLVRPLGHRNDVPELLSACDLFVLSTRSEGMSLSVLEAMAAGLPVVVSRVDGIEEVIEHGRTGLLVPPGDPEALAQALDFLIRFPERRRQMGQQALDRVRTEFQVRPRVEETGEWLYRWAQQAPLDTASVGWEPSLLKPAAEVVPAIGPGGLETHASEAV